jgi:hypothetical protein
METRDVKRTKAKQTAQSEQKAAAKAAAKEAFFPTLRELVRAYQAFADYSLKHVREVGLTAPQFDVISTLGNTTGMTMGN